MEKNQNRIYSGWKMNGFAMLFIVLLSWVAGPALAIYGGVNFATLYDAIAVVAREIKQLKETLETAPEAYVEIKEECAAKIAVLSEFMPKQMDVDEIKEVIKGVLDALGIENPEAKLKGIIMKNLMPLVKGKADGKLVNEVLATFFK